MKTIVVYYSLSGNNKRLANYLVEKLNSETFEIKTKKKLGFFDYFKGLFFKKFPQIEEYKIDLKSYDKIIFASPVWFGKLPFPLKSFLNNEKSNIKIYDYLSVCLGGQKSKIESELTSLLNKSPFYIEEFSFQKLKKSNKMKLFDKLDEKDFEELRKEIDLTIDKI